MTDLLLDVKNLRTEFSAEEGQVIAVNSISFQVLKGETVGIVGESGSGKSVTALSLMRLLSSLGKITSGELLFHSGSQGDVDLTRLSEKQIRKLRGNEMAMVFQEPMSALNPVFTCGNQVIESLILHKKLSKAAAKKRCLELFSEVQLDNPERIYKSYPHQLSGGQKQRVLIAMAICCNPDLLIADEPTTSLDVTLQKTILALLRKLQQKQGMSMLFISHDLAVIAEIADRVLVMYKGEIVEQGSVKDIFKTPQNPYTKGLLACRPPLDLRLKRLPVISDFMAPDAAGVLSESNVSVEQFRKALQISTSERKTRLDKLYAQTPLLQVKNLKTIYPISNGLFGNVTAYTKAVDEVNFDVYPGEILGLVGESGCGKTTLGRSILRLIEPNSGEVYYKGKNLLQLDDASMRKLRKEMQLIFQDPYSSLNPRMTIGKAIMEPMQVHGLYANDTERRKKVIELLERVSMNESHFNRYPHEFSGGQRQRVCIARALSVQPQFIICDESVSALDVSVQAQVLNLIRELRDEFGFTCIFISHDLSVVKFMSDRMMVMHKGKIEEIGDADAIYAAPKSAYTQALIAAIPSGGLDLRNEVSSF
ncbi:MAG: ABC transporter ATP-binding protein [Bacteroidetes bacterium]|nr:ABC transporter ATP-binding protein [Bacteroidota bacterium]